MAHQEKSKSANTDSEMYANQPFSRAVLEKKSGWYERVKLSVVQLDWIIRVAVAALIVVFLLIILEAAGIYKI